MFVWNIKDGKIVIEMEFYVTVDKNGYYHVQNVVMGLLGQHHVHTKEGYERWAKKINPKYIHFLGEGECRCDLKPGDVREYDGTVWHNKEFE
jgi:hypothetical protein